MESDDSFKVITPDSLKKDQGRVPLKFNNSVVGYAELNPETGLLEGHITNAAAIPFIDNHLRGKSLYVEDLPDDS